MSKDNTDGKKTIEDLHNLQKEKRKENSKLLAGWNGAKFYAKIAGHFTMGLSAAATLVTSAAEIKGYNFVYPKPLTIALSIGWVLMATVAATVLGKFLVEKGKQ